MDSSEGGFGKTTIEMMTQSTYKDWDFETIWCIDEGKDYPRLQVFDSCSGVTVEENTVFEKSLIETFPNPFKESFDLKYELPKTERVSISIYNSLGIQVYQQDLGIQDSGIHRTSINLSTQPQGIYYYSLNIGNECKSGKLILMK